MYRYLLQISLPASRRWIEQLCSQLWAGTQASRLPGSRMPGGSLGIGRLKAIPKHQK
jgi:hypothetical protein